MANSGTVTAGSAALASQYNNLRDDVLNISTGHTHTGASEDGKKVEGSAIASTGATNGQVLAADGAGGAAFTTLAGGGAFTFISGTAAFSVPSDGGTIFTYSGGGNGVHEFATTGGGTVIIHNISAQFTTTNTLFRRVLNSNTIVASTALAPATAGTTFRTPFGYGFNGGTAFVVLERGKTGSVVTYSLRKLNVAMTSVMWSTTLVSGSATTTSYDTQGPFERDAGGVRYAAGPGIWYGGDQRTHLWTAGTMQVASVWVVNDVSGSAYSAPFGSAVGVIESKQEVIVRGAVFVPSATAATNGTIHAWGTEAGTPRYVNYAVGSASISAISTAIGVYGGYATNQTELAIYPAPLTVVNTPERGTYLANSQKIVLYGSNRWWVFDRTFSTAEYQSPQSSGNQFYGFRTDNRNIDAGAFDETTGYLIAENGYSRIGGIDGQIAPMGSAVYFADTNFYYNGALAGNGSATHMIAGISNTGGSAASFELGGIAKVPFGTTSTTRRLMTITAPQASRILAIDAGGGGVALAGIAAGTSNLFATNQYSFVAGTGQVYVYVAQPPTVLQYAPPWYVIGSNAQGGTAIVSGHQVALS